MNHELFSMALLAGGLAKRLEPLTESIPKSLLDIHGRPFIDFQLRLISSQSIRNVILCVGHLGEKIRDAVGDGSEYGLNISYSFDGPVLMGTAGSIQKALPLLSDPFFVLYGDSYLECNFKQVAEAFLKDEKKALMTVYRNEGRWDSSNIEFCDGRIIAYNKNDRTELMHHIDYGLSIFSKAAFDMLSPGSASDLEPVYQHWIQRDQLAAFEVSQRFYEVGSKKGLEEFRAMIESRIDL